MAMNEDNIWANVNYRRTNNGITIDFNAKGINKSAHHLTQPQAALSESVSEVEQLKKKLRKHSKEEGKGIQSQSPLQSALQSQSKSQWTNANQIESKSVQLHHSQHNKSTGKPEISENSIVKTDKGYEIYFVENSVSRKNKSSNKDKEDLTVQEEINTKELISENYGLKEAIKNNEDTYNSLEKEFMFNTNNNPYSTSNLLNNNQLLLNLSDANYLNSISNNNKDTSACNNHIIINFNNYNYQFSPCEGDTSNIKRFNSNNLSIEDLSMYSRQNSKLVKKKIFQNNPVCNLSNRIVNDENNANNKTHLDCNGFDYKFIDDVKQNAHMNRLNKLKKMIPLSKFLQLKKKMMLLIVHFAYDDIDEIRNSYESVMHKINATLSWYYYPVVEQFMQVYGSDLELYEYYFCTNKKRASESLMSSSIFNRRYKPKTKYVSLDLHIKARIVSSQINQTHSISLLFNEVNRASTTDQMILTWKYNVIKGEHISIWIASEVEEFEGRISRFSYIQPIVSYAIGDFISLKLPVLFQNNSIDHTKAMWVPMEKTAYLPEKSNYLLHEKSVYHNTHASLMKRYDKVRFCELETFIHLWKSVKSLTNRKMIDDLRRMLLVGEIFDELAFEFDLRRLYIFKVKLKAIKIGRVKRNKYFNFDLIIKEPDSSITNETQCLGLLNSINSQYELRIGEILVFYFTEIGG